MSAFSKYFIFCLLVCLAVGCKAESDAGGDGGTDTDTNTDTESDTPSDTDTGTGTGEPDTTEGWTDCEIMEAIIQNAVDDYCADFLEACCYCLCWDKEMGFDPDAYFDKGECVCVETDPPQECEDAYLEQAESCVADLDACYDLYYNAAETGCNMTPLK